MAQIKLPLKQVESINVDDITQLQSNLDNKQGLYVEWQELTANYTLTLSDVGKIFYNNSATNYKITIPLNSVVTFGQDIAFTIVHFSTGLIQIDKAVGVTADTNQTTTASVPVTVLRQGIDNWIYTGSSGSFASYTP